MIDNDNAPKGLGRVINLSRNRSIIKLVPLLMAALQEAITKIETLEIKLLH